ncbi:MAG: uracil phosphoribosyltransferase [Bacteroidota bacterium]|nr:uracil phosphoribosyltransferase [Bacteroidota bacterium]
MKSFLEGVQYLFENILFAPMNFFASTELENWWTANLINWIFTIICCVYMVYWLKQLQIFKKNNEDDQDTTAHSFLK